jgi:predicted ArsR family transcriptional regulator
VHEPTPLSPSHRGLLDALKRRRRCTIPELARELELNVETLREHLQTLVARQLVQRVGSAKGGPGRPSILYALTESAEALFPRNEGELLRGLSAFLVESGHSVAAEVLRPPTGRAAPCRDGPRRRARRRGAPAESAADIH